MTGCKHARSNFKPSEIRLIDADKATHTISLTIQSGNAQPPLACAFEPGLLSSVGSHDSTESRVMWWHLRDREGAMQARVRVSPAATKRTQNRYSRPDRHSRW
jgi:hypothetical protein